MKTMRMLTRLHIPLAGLRPGIPAVVLLLVGCGPNSVPRYPPALDTQRFVEAAVPTAVADDRIVVSIAECRPATHGLYVDLFVRGPESRVQDIAPILGEACVPLADQLFAVESAGGSSVTLHPAVRDASEYVNHPLTFKIASALTLGGSAPQLGPGALAAQTYTIADGVVIQTVPVRLEQDLVSGKYVIRLTPLWNQGLSESFAPREKYALERHLDGKSIVASEAQYVFLVGR